MEEAIEKLTTLLHGGLPEAIDNANVSAPCERQLVELLNRLFALMREIHQFIIPLSKGRLDEIESIAPRNYLGSPFKELHSLLLHLTWQAEQVARGDYSQRLDFMGDFSEAFNAMVVSLEVNETKLRKKIKELETALSRISKLEGILPICANCKKIRMEGADPCDQGSWVSVESYISKRSVVRFTHSICPACRKALYPDLV